MTVIGRHDEKRILEIAAEPLNALINVSDDFSNRLMTASDVVHRIIRFTPVGINIVSFFFPAQAFYRVKQLLIFGNSGGAVQRDDICFCIPRLLSFFIDRSVPQILSRRMELCSLLLRTSPGVGKERNDIAQFREIQIPAEPSVFRRR